MSKQKALKKIAKCLELGNSSNVNEAAQAIKMAHRLMLKYGLEQDDIALIKMGKTRSTHLLPANVSHTLLRIIRTINSKFGVEAVLLNHKGLKCAEFIGEADKAIFAAFAFDIIYREMNSNIGQFRNSFAGTGTNQSEVTRKVESFTMGWVEGALDKLPTIASETSSKSINDYIDKEFQQIDRETFKKQMKNAINQLTSDYEVGLKKGKRINVSRPINGEQRQQIKELSHKNTLKNVKNK